MSQKIHPFFRQTAGEAQALYERKRIADMLICSNWMRHPTLTVKATFTSGEVNFNNSIIDHFRLSDFQTQTIPKLASESIQLVLKSSHHTAFGFTDEIIIFQKGIKKLADVEVVGEKLAKMAVGAICASFSRL